ncbi:MAG: hypothetical protein ACFFAE_02070 [Candidatus Hodarchaeota archaeon]
MGRYNLETESKRLLHKEEQFVSGTEIVKYNESIYILTLLFLLVILILTLFNSIFFLLVLVTPIFLLFSNELELYILTNDRIIVVRRAIFEKLLKIQNETSIALDQIVILSYSRAPLNRNALYIGGIGIIGIPLVIMNYEKIYLPEIIKFIIIIVLTILTLYLIWIGLRLTRRSVELSLIGVPEQFGVGRSKGVPIWFVFDIQNLIFGKLRSSIPLLVKKETQTQKDKIEYYTSIQELVDSTPIELHKKILIELHKRSQTQKQVMTKLSSYSKSEINRSFSQLRKKRLIYFNRKTDTWAINKSLNIGIKK